MDIKVCTKCGKGKPTSDFYYLKKKECFDSRCKECVKKHVREYKANNPDKVRESKRDSYQRTRASVRAKQSAYRRENRDAINARARKKYQKDPESRLESNRKSKLRHGHRWGLVARPPSSSPKVQRTTSPGIKAYMKAWHAKQRATNPRYRIAKRVSERIREVVRKGGRCKSQPTFHLLGYTPEALMEHLEKQFLRGMSWDNYGDWHIDHIVPVREFDLSDDEGIARAWALTNLRPLWAADNLKKNARRLYLI